MACSTLPDMRMKKNPIVPAWKPLKSRWWRDSGRWSGRSEAVALLAHVEAELDHVAVLHDVFLAFDPQLADFLRAVLGAGGNEVVVVDDFRGDEAAFEIGVDHAGGCRGLVALMDR